ncbi:MAG: 6-phosphogluconolactonase [Cytophagales bacterium]
MDINIYKTSDELAENLANHIISNYLNNNIALSGGSTPLKLFKVLSKKLDKLENKMKFFWVDERCVPPESDESNYKMAESFLFNSKNINRENIYRIKGENQASEEVTRYSKTLRNNLDIVGNFPCFDLVILGLGDDGHTASIFPYELNKFKNESDCVVATHPTSGQKRISLSEKIINNSKEIIFHVSGSGKKNVVDEIINKRGDYEKYPASHIKPNSGGKISWYLDFEAADNLTK